MDRIERTVARDVNIDDPHEAMDYFLDVYRCTYHSPFRVGCSILGNKREMTNILFFLEASSYAAFYLGQEVASEFHTLVQNACSEIRSIKLVKLDSKDRLERIQSLHAIIFKHLVIFDAFIIPRLNKRKEEMEVRGVAMSDIKLELADSSGDDGQISID